MVVVKFPSGKDVYYDGYLLNALDTIVYNVQNDWDFLILITGDRQVRTGKSVLGIQVSSYLSYRLGPSYTIKNIFFDSQNMIDMAQDAPMNSVIHYDEGREGLAASKTAKQIQKDLLDYFAECGQLNHVFVIVLPDFFELKEQIAVGRSECLINVYRKGKETMQDIYKEGNKIPVTKFTRGFFEFFSRNKKRDLYDKSKTTKRRNYGIIKSNFIGRFTNNYADISEEEYRKKKKDALSRFKENKEKELTIKKTDVIRDKIIQKLSDEGLSGPKIADRLEKEYGYTIDRSNINRILKRMQIQKMKDLDAGF